MPALIARSSFRNVLGVHHSTASKSGNRLSLHPRPRTQPKHKHGRSDKERQPDRSEHNRQSTKTSSTCGTGKNNHNDDGGLGRKEGKDSCKLISKADKKLNALRCSHSTARRLPTLPTQSDRASASREDKQLDHGVGQNNRRQ